MGVFIVRNTDTGEYLTARKPVSSGDYMSRSGWSTSIDDAKIFRSKGAATNSARQNGKGAFKVLEGKLVTNEIGE